MFDNCNFVITVVEEAALPPYRLPEVAFAGRSNVGKSSLINALCKRKGLAHASKTPGRTQALNYFNIDDLGHLVDMPGYGYAAVSKGKVADWNQLILDYIAGRVELKRLFVLIDIRRGLNKTDLPFLEKLNQYAVPYQFVITKADKVKPPAVKKVEVELEAFIAKNGAALDGVIATSSEKGTGIDALRKAIMGVYRA